MTVNPDPIDIYPEYCLDDDLHDLIKIHSVQVDQSALDHWLMIHNGKANYTRLLRYFLSSTLLDLHQEDVILDVGSGDSIFAFLIGDKVRKVILNDLSIEQGLVPSNVILAQQNIFSLDFADYGITKITVGHAFEHFRGNDDIKLIEWIGRALPEGGRACIEPLFIGKRYLEVYSYPTDEQYDLRAIPIVTRESNFPGRKDHHMGFARIYDGQALYERVVKTAEKNGLECKIISFKTGDEYLPDMTKYVYKRRNINYPLRALLLSK